VRVPDTANRGLLDRIALGPRRAARRLGCRAVQRKSVDEAIGSTAQIDSTPNRARCWSMDRRCVEERWHIRVRHKSASVAIHYG